MAVDDRTAAPRPICWTDIVGGRCQPGSKWGRTVLEGTDGCTYGQSNWRQRFLEPYPHPTIDLPETARLIRVPPLKIHIPAFCTKSWTNDGTITVAGLFWFGESGFVDQVTSL